MVSRRHSIEFEDAGAAAEKSDAMDNMSDTAAAEDLEGESGGCSNVVQEEIDVELADDYLRLFEFARGGASCCFSDVVFVVEGKPVAAHRCVLAARSKFFAALLEEAARGGGGSQLVVPVQWVGYEAFVAVMRFVYSGRLILEVRRRRENSSDHDHSNEEETEEEYSGGGAGGGGGVDAALLALSAAAFFAMPHLSYLLQRHLIEMIDGGILTTDDIIRVLSAAEDHGLLQLRRKCAALLASSAVRRRHAPEISAQIEALRHHSAAMPIDALQPMRSSRTILRMRQALDSMDMELLSLMVMSEGLNLDEAGALHYAVASCGRQAAKALLEMGAVDVNGAFSAAADERRRTALQIACEMADPDLISLLLDHHASPSLSPSASNDAPLDIIRFAISAASAASSASYQESDSGVSAAAPPPEEGKLRLCLELLQSAAFVEARGSSCIYGGRDRDPESDRSTTYSNDREQESQLLEMGNCSKMDDDREQGGGGAAPSCASGGGGGGGEAEDFHLSAAEIQYSDHWTGGRGSTVESSCSLNDQALTPNSVLQLHHGLLDQGLDVRVHTLADQQEHYPYYYYNNNNYNSNNTPSPLSFLPINHLHPKNRPTYQDLDHEFHLNLRFPPLLPPINSPDSSAINPPIVCALPYPDPHINPPHQGSNPFYHHTISDNFSLFYNYNTHS